MKLPTAFVSELVVAVTVGSPEVSVVIGVYNGASGIAMSLDSVLRQEGTDLECIVVDDGSDDGTADILSAYAQRNERLRVVRQRHAGLTRALIHGCALARGKYVARQDVGDVSFPGRLAMQARILEQHEEVVLVGCGYRLAGPGGELLREFAGDDDTLVTSVLRDARKDTLRGPHHGTVMFRRGTYQDVGGYRSSFYFAQDLDLWTRLVEKGSFVCVAEILCQVEFSYESISAQNLPHQTVLKALISEATALRRRGKPETPALSKAAKIGPANYSRRRILGRRAASAYFVGSCLADRGDRKAIRYFKETLVCRPWHVKAWMKLARMAMGIGLQRPAVSDGRG